MKIRILWTIAILLLLVHLGIQYLFFTPVTISGKAGMGILVMDLSTNLFLVFFTVLVIVPIVALIPFKGMVYSEKFIRILPYVASIVLIIIIANFGYMAYLKKVKHLQSGPVHHYEDIQVPLKLDCNEVHNGQFETEHTRIVRNEKVQIQVDKNTGAIKEYLVDWINECEYTLTPKLGNSEKLKIKITAVNQDNYGCYVVSDQHPDQYAQFVVAKILLK